MEKDRDRFLRIYMNDQLALGVAWREVARRAKAENEGMALGEALARVETGISEDIEAFESMMERLGLERDRLKPALATVAERLGRLKPNGQLRGYSPLSRFAELDLLAMGIESKKVLWANLRDFGELGRRLPGVDFDELIERAGRQRAELEPFRARSGRETFGTPA